MKKNGTVTEAKSLLFNVTTNLSESFNNHIAKQIDGKRINFALRFSYKARCLMAVLQFNEGQSISLIFKEANIRVPSVGWKLQLTRRLEVIKRCDRINSSGVSIKKPKFVTADQDYGKFVPEKSTAELIRLKKKHYDKLKEWQNDRVGIEERTAIKDAKGINEWLSKRRQLITGTKAHTIVRGRYTESSIRSAIKQNLISSKNRKQ